MRKWVHERAIIKESFVDHVALPTDPFHPWCVPWIPTGPPALTESIARLKERARERSKVHMEPLLGGSPFRRTFSKSVKDPYATEDDPPNLDALRD